MFSLLNEYVYELLKHLILNIYIHIDHIDMASPRNEYVHELLNDSIFYICNHIDCIEMASHLNEYAYELLNFEMLLIYIHIDHMQTASILECIRLCLVKSLECKNFLGHTSQESGFSPK